MSGAGNLFSVIDNRIYGFDIGKLISLAPILCGKNEINNFSTEGLIALQNSSEYNFMAEFLNPDGSYGAMCGNGGRCAVAFANTIKLTDNKKSVCFKMAGSVYSATINQDNTVSLEFPPLIEYKENITIKINNLKILLDYLDVGADHVVINYDNINLNKKFRDFDINELGRKIRFHNFFRPKGTNVNFFQIENNHTVQLRTYERGVEAETGACGTGTIATAIVCNRKYNLSFPIKIIPPSRIPLFVDVKYKGENVETVILTGPAEILRHNKIEISDDLLKEVKHD